MTNQLVAFIPARGGSKSIPLKNIREIGGKPLIYWVIEAALAAKCIDRVYVATDSAVIATCVKQLGHEKVIVIGRCLDGASDTASSEQVLLEFCNSYAFNHVFFIQATSPLLTGDDLDGAWVLFNQGKYDSLLSVVQQRRFLWEEQSGGSAFPVNYNLLQRPRRQDFHGFLVENGAFYLSSRQLIMQSGCRISGRIGCYQMSVASYYELDEAEDWVIVENFLHRRIKHEQSIVGPEMRR